MKNLTRMIGAYIKQNIKLILGFILIAFTFLIVFILYNIQIETVLYGSVLCIFLGSTLAVVDFYFFYKKHEILVELLNHISYSTNSIVVKGSLLEQDYQQLVNVLLQEKTELVSKADNEKSDMLDYYTLWAHQIKTPIAAMRLLLQTNEVNNSEEIAMELFKIEQYVEMVLQYVRLGSDTSDYLLKKNKLEDIVKQGIRKYAKLFIKKKISLEFSTISYQVITDEKWLLFVIEQILFNALKYTNEGKISIYMERNSVLVIEDTGIGIQSEDLPRVFEKGFTGYNGRNDKKSTGLGLYLCKRILTKLSHEINIESQVGKGTKVMIGLNQEHRIFE